MKQKFEREQGGARHFHLGGPLEGPVLQQGELSMVCVGLSEEDLKNFGGPRKIWGGIGTPLAPPLNANLLARATEVFRLEPNETVSTFVLIVLVVMRRSCSSNVDYHCIEISVTLIFVKTVITKGLFNILPK